MLDALFLACAAAVLVGTIVALARVQKRLELEPVWFALTFLGACAAVLTLVGKDILFRLYRTVVLPADLSAEQFLSGPYGLLFLPLVTAGLMEALKAGGVFLFHTHFTRSRWPLYAISIGAGAGLLDAFHVLGATVAAVVGGEHVVDGDTLWLPLRYAAGVLFHAALTPLVLYAWAFDRRWLGWALGAAIHATALGLIQWLHHGAGVETPLMPIGILLAAGGLAGGALYTASRRIGWPL